MWESKMFDVTWNLLGWWVWTTVGDRLRYHRRAADSEGDLPPSAVRLWPGDRQTTLEVRDTQESEPGECSVHLHCCGHSQPRLWRRVCLHRWCLQVQYINTCFQVFINMIYPLRVLFLSSLVWTSLQSRCYILYFV